VRSGPNVSSRTTPTATSNPFAVDVLVVMDD